MAWDNWIEAAASAANRMGPWLLDVSVRSLVLLALTGAVAAALRRAAAATRHWMWVMGFAGLLLLPVLGLVVPGWRVLPQVGQTPVAGTGWQIVDGPAAPAEAAPADRKDATAADSAARESKHMAAAPGTDIAYRNPEASPESPTSVGRAATEEPRNTTIPSGVTAALEPAAHGTQRTRITWVGWLTLLWLGGALAVAGYSGMGYLSLWLLQRRCRPMRRGDWREQLEQLAKAMKVRRPVELMISPLRAMPMTWGLWQTRLLLPEQAVDWTLAQRQAVLLHELGHVRRWDCLTQLLAQCIGALYWCNPLVWVAWRRMQLEREVACDDLVLESGALASAYAQHLVQSAAAMPTWRFASAAGLAMARPSTLEERVRAILDGRRPRGTLSRRYALTTLGVLGAVLVPVAVLQGRGPAAPVPAATGTKELAEAATTTGLSVAEPRAAQEDTNCALVATIYDVRVPVADTGRIDMEKLAQAAGSVAGFEKALAGLGMAHPLYHADQSVRLAGDTISVSTSTPYVSNSQVTPGGQTVNAISYRDTGALFSIAGRAQTKPAKGLEVDLGIRMTTISEGNVAISESVKAPTFRTVTLNYKGSAETQRPLVMMSGDGAAVDANGNAVVYVARVMLNMDER